VLNAILPYLDKPFALFGHSMGALVSFELSRQLRTRYGLIPTHLFISGRRAPQIPDNDPPVHTLPEAEFMEELRSLNGIPNVALEIQELMRLLAPIIRADFEMCETYVYADAPRLSCPISAFGGLTDTEISREDVEAWRAQTSASFILRMLPGDHFFLNTAQPLLLQALSRDLYQTLAAVEYS
jgi:medium-chain acyl-[acyl-carrier-protein] hydrolase